MKLQSICVFCAANSGVDPAYVAAAHALGVMLAKSGRRVVYGGGRTGLMGALGDGVLSAGGEVIGVMPRHLVEREVAHTGLSELRVVDSMHERKTLLSVLGDGFLAMPGGLGTLEELFEMWTWGQLGLHRKPYGVLNVLNYFTPLLTFLDHAVSQGFLGAEIRAALVVSANGGELLQSMETAELPKLRTWIDHRST